MSYHPALLQLLGTCPCPPPVTAAQGREERKHDHFSHCRLQKWEIFFFASQHKNPISRMPVRCSLKEGDMTKGVQRLKLQLQCKPAIVMRFCSVSMRQNNQGEFLLDHLAPIKVSTEPNQAGQVVMWEFIRIILVLTPTCNLVIPSQSC
ncbi:uncharacterized protein M8220_003781 isoform 1-T1 [Acridotheres tristis]